VACELGHQSDEMVKRIYAHLGSTGHRSDMVEYRVAPRLEKLGDRLRRLGFAGNVTGGGVELETEPPPTPKSQRGKIFQSGPGAIRTRDLLLRRGIRTPRSADRR
jgi:hypothetical protein